MRVYHDFNFIEVKSLSEESGFYTLEGMATTNTPDRQDDIVEPYACRFAPVIPLLLGHDAKQPVGEARLGRPTSKGIPFTAKIPVITKPGKLKEMIDYVIDQVQLGLIRCVSIGFRVLSGGSERLPSGGKRFTNVEVMELSLCVLPAQPEATINSVRGGGKPVKMISTTKPVIPVKMIRRDGPVQIISASKPVKMIRANKPVKMIPIRKPVKLTCEKLRPVKMMTPQQLADAHRLTLYQQHMKILEQFQN